MKTVTELRQAVAKEADLPVRQVERALDAMSTLMAKELSAGNNVVIPGLGFLKPKIIAAHVAHNPRTGDPIDVPEKRRVKFQPSAGLARLL